MLKLVEEAHYYVEVNYDHLLLTNKLLVNLILRHLNDVKLIEFLLFELKHLHTLTLIDFSKHFYLLALNTHRKDYNPDIRDEFHSGYLM